MRNRGVIVGLAVAGAVVAAASAAQAFTITPSYGPGSTPPWDANSIAVGNEAISEWTSMLSYTDPNQNIAMNFVFSNGGSNPLDPATYLGRWVQSIHGTQGESLNPWSPEVGHTFQINLQLMTVRGTANPPSYPDYLVLNMTLDSPTANQWDGLTVMRRVLGQALGFTQQYPDSVGMVSGPNKWQDQVTITGSNAVFDQTPGGLNIPLASATNTVQFADSTDLMGQGALPTGTRVGISFQDLEALSLAYGYAITVPAGTSFNSPSFKTQTITLNGTVRVASGNAPAGTPGAALTSQNFSMGTNGLLDISNHELIIRGGTTLSQAQLLVAAGRGGTTGITSSTAGAGLVLGVGTAGAINVSTFDGVSVAPTDILVKATYLGDANLDGHVDTTDLNTVLNNFGRTTADWTSGNFDGSPTIDLTDLAWVMNNFGKNVAGGSATTGGTLAVATPEPASLALLAGAGTLLLRRKSRRA